QFCFFHTSLQFSGLFPACFSCGIIVPTIDGTGRMTMRYYFAPMEGITSYLHRAIHRRFFPGVDRYYMPFVSPSQRHASAKREKADLSPEHDAGVPAGPPLLTRRAEDFIWAAGELAHMGYREVNLNLGCPSGTVTAKGKGSGFL